MSEPADAAEDLRPGGPVPFRAGWVLVRRLGAGGGGDAWLGQEQATQDVRVFKFADGPQALGDRQGPMMGEARRRPRGDIAGAFQLQPYHPAKREEVDLPGDDRSAVTR